MLSMVCLASVAMLGEATPALSEYSTRASTVEDVQAFDKKFPRSDNVTIPSVFIDHGQVANQSWDANTSVDDHTVCGDDCCNCWYNNWQARDQRAHDKGCWNSRFSFRVTDNLGTCYCTCENQGCTGCKSEASMTLV